MVVMVVIVLAVATVAYATTRDDAPCRGSYTYGSGTNRCNGEPVTSEEADCIRLLESGRTIDDCQTARTRP